MSEIALLGKKIGMTREFYKTGQLVPVTVLKVEKARVIQVIEEEKRGYKAVQLGYGKVKNSKLTKSMKGVFAKKNRGINSSFTIRKISYGEGVERVFPLYSPKTASIEVVRRGAVRRSKLYYLRGRTGKKARIAEKIDTKNKKTAKVKDKDN